MSTVARFLGRFGNNIFQLSAALKLSNGEEVLVNPGKYTGKDGFTNIKITNKNWTIPPGNYQHKKWLLPKEQLLYYIKKVEVPSYKWALHIRGKDYLHIYPDCVRSREHILHQFEYFNLNPTEVKVVTDDPVFAKTLVPQQCKIIRSDHFLKDWWILRNAENLILSPGTFSYTAAYLGDHNRVIMPRLWPWDIILKKDPTSVERGIDLKFDTWELEQEYIKKENTETIRKLLPLTERYKWKRLK